VAEDKPKSPAPLFGLAVVATMGFVMFVLFFALKPPSSPAFVSKEQSEKAERDHKEAGIRREENEM
jgi:hypothetical protein